MAQMEAAKPKPKFPVSVAEPKPLPVGNIEPPPPSKVLTIGAIILRRMPLLALGFMLIDYYRSQLGTWNPTVDVPSGWSLENTCDPIHGTVYKAGTNACSLLQAWPQSSDMPGPYVGRMVFLRGYTGPGGFTFGKVTHVYTRTTPGVTWRDRPTFVGRYPKPPGLLSLLPSLRPINVPLDIPAPLPYRWLPFASPTDFPYGRTMGNQPPGMVQRRLRVGRLFPVGHRGPSFETKHPNDYVPGRPISRTYTPVGTRTRVKTKVKERKYKYTKFMARVWQFLGHATEVGDHIKALFDAMNSKKRNQWITAYTEKHGHGPDLYAKARYVYSNWDDITYDKWKEIVIENDIEDRIIGEFGKRVAKYSRLHQRPVGYQAGPALEGMGSPVTNVIPGT